VVDLQVVYLQVRGLSRSWTSQVVDSPGSLLSRSCTLQVWTLQVVYSQVADFSISTNPLLSASAPVIFISVQG
ncbi:hypothetical protein KUCAC02_034082, partial [Chaenocephalus aceratus]